MRRNVMGGCTVSEWNYISTLIVLSFLVVSNHVIPATAWMRTTLADRLMGMRATTTMLPSASQPQQQQQQQQPQTTNPSTTTTTTTKQNQRDMIDFMERPPISMTMRTMKSSSSSSSSGLVQEQGEGGDGDDDADVMDLVHCIVRAADGRKADDIRALRVGHVSTLTTFLVVLSGNSRPQNAAIAKAVLDAVRERYGDAVTPGGTGVPEGSPESGWMVLDYGSVMVHIMTPKSRLFYNVEGQWREKGGSYVDLSSIVVPNTSISSTTTPMTTTTTTTTNDDTDTTAEVRSPSQQQQQQQAEDDPFWS